MDNAQNNGHAYSNPLEILGHKVCFGIATQFHTMCRHFIAALSFLTHMLAQ
jgi:hypothetical protein